MNSMTDKNCLEGRDTTDGQGLTEKERHPERVMPGQEYGRKHMREWVNLRERNAYTRNQDFQHTLAFHLGAEMEALEEPLTAFGAIVPTELDRAVTENDFRPNNPRIDAYDSIGDRIDKVVHHPAYAAAGDMIYGTGLVRQLTTLGGLRKGLATYFLAAHTGEAGHMCPVICNYETARVLRGVEDFPERQFYIDKLEHPSYSQNYTSSQFLTEVQGGSDVGANDVRAWQDDQGKWYVRGEKWFCSNADAELMVISARRSMARTGTKGLSMFLVPSTKADGTRNDFFMRRLKEKLGTRALASAEIDFQDAEAIPLGDTFNFMLENVVHHSRIALAVAVLGFTSRAFQLAMDFSQTRSAFGQSILRYPLVRENLAQIKSDIMASLAGTYALIALQDRIDTGETDDETEVGFCRLMVNIGKSVISKRAVYNIHHCIDAIGGNGAIENTSSLPRLMRDAIIFENWEGTHNTLYMQSLRDILRFHHDVAYVRTLDKMITALGAGCEGEVFIARAALDRLRDNLSKLRGADHDLQTLIVRQVVRQMADLFYYVALITEGADQMRRGQGQSKLQAARLFARTRLEGGDTVDEDYIDLCTSVLG